MCYEPKVGDLKKLLANVPDDYVLKLQSVEDGIAVPDGEDRCGRTYRYQKYSIDSRSSTVKTVEVDQDCKEVQLNVYLFLEENY